MEPYRFEKRQFSSTLTSFYVFPVLYFFVISVFPSSFETRLNLPYVPFP